MFPLICVSALGQRHSGSVARRCPRCWSGERFECFSNTSSHNYITSMQYNSKSFSLTTKFSLGFLTGTASAVSHYRIDVCQVTSTVTLSLLCKRGTSIWRHIWAIQSARFPFCRLSYQSAWAVAWSGSVSMAPGETARLDERPVK